MNKEEQKEKISDEIAKIEIMSIDSLSIRTKAALLRNNFYYLGDILACNYNHIMGVRNIGKHSMADLLNYIHSLGLTIKGEKTLDLGTILEEKGISLAGEKLELDQETRDEIAKAPIMYLDLPARIKNALLRNNFYYLGDVLACNYNSIKHIRNMGNNTMTILTDYLHTYGLSLKGEPSPELIDNQVTAQETKEANENREKEQRHNIETAKARYKELSEQQQKIAEEILTVIEKPTTEESTTNSNNSSDGRK